MLTSFRIAGNTDSGWTQGAQRSSSIAERQMQGGISYLSPVQRPSNTTISRSTDFPQKEAHKNYTDVANLIIDLSLDSDDEDVDEDEYGATIPTEYAKKRALTIFGEIYQQYLATYPLPIVSLSFDGGIRIQWMYPRSSLRLVIPAREEDGGYIYFEHNDSYGTESVSAENLANRITWLLRVVRHAESD